MEYIIYCDESISKGKFYSDFYGGALVRSTDLLKIVNALNSKKIELFLKGEIKWTKVTSNYLEKYVTVINLFFDFIENGKVKIRVMFRQNAQVPLNISKENSEKGFHLLYYQFIKHAFGLRFSGMEEETFIRLYFDRLPENKIKNEQFLNYIFGLQSLLAFHEAKLKIKRQDIAEVNSHDHVILQCMDIILGAIAFRLNDLHKEKEGNKRGKRTIAKEKLYKVINQRIRRIYPGFNIGITTSKVPLEKIWEMSYRHWKFKPKEFVIDETRYK